jgi:hypothetical protein
LFEFFFNKFDLYVKKFAQFYFHPILLKGTYVTFFLLKQDIHSFKLIEFKFNIAKNVNDESANKLSASKLITYNGKMLTTNNMIKLKSPKYPFFPDLQR